MKYRYLLLLPLLFILAGCDSSGDRVLVAKFLSETGVMEPRRYDVVVFKYPKQPIENGTPKNYIKRLIGLPGEILAIFFGRLYVFAFNGELPQGVTEEDWRELTKPPTTSSGEKVSKLDLWEYLQKDHATAQKLWDHGAFSILRKPPPVMLALSRPVFDNDHQAADLAGVLPERWAPQGAASWAADSAHGFKNAGAGKDPEWLRYRHIIRPGPTEWPSNNDPHRKAKIEAIKNRTHKPQLITDFMGYNTYESQRHSTPPPNWAGDLMLECNLTVDQPKGQFCMEVNKGVDRFQARFDLATGVCTLYRNTNHADKWELLGTADTNVKAAGSYRLRFANYDERLTVWVGRDLPFEDGKEYPPPAERGPDTAPTSDNLDEIKNNDLQPAGFCSVGAAVQVHNIKLWRDTYYTGSATNASDHNEAVAGDDWKNPLKWDPLRHLKSRTFYVYPGHYLCLGDNSPESSDSRHWGLVPERLMLGRALVVYFPFERAGTIK